MTDWTPLDAEISACRRMGHVTDLWWRDDDAVAVSPELDQLQTLAGRFDLPVHLAVIPHGLTQSLIDRVAASPDLVPLVHGWRHQNHAPAGTKTSEFGATRAIQDRARDAREAWNRLQSAFTGRMAPVFVPPWNRIAQDLYPELARIGYRAVSGFTPRKTPYAAPGLLRINTHLDPVNWKGDRGLADPDTLVRLAAQHLYERRTGLIDDSEPYGLLTHHLVQDQATWDFCAAFLERMLSAECRIWRADIHPFPGDTHEPT